MQQLILLVLIFISSIPLAGDTVYLKNGRKIHGIILEQDTALVKMEISIGRTAYKLTEIDSIQKASRTANDLTRKTWAEQSNKKAIKGKFDEAEDLLRRLKENFFKDESINLAAFYRKKQSSDLDKEIFELNQKYLKANNQIKDLSYWDDPKLYNKLFDERNRLHGEIEQKKQQYPDFTNADKAEIAEKHSELFVKFEQSLAKLKASDLDKNEEQHLAKISSEYRSLTFQDEDNSVKIQYSKNNSVIVKVLINGRQSGRFILDTGASCVVISERFAKKLNIDISNIRPEDAFVADGSKINSYPAMLASVAVGKFKSENVEARVIKTQPGENIDGLLGMTYLKNYDLSLDAQANKLFFRVK